MGILFVDDDSIAVGLSGDLAIEILGINGDTQRLKIQANFMWEAIPRDHRLVLATEHGIGLYLDTTHLHVLNEVPLCQGRASGLKMLPDQRTVAFSCREGAVGIWNLESHTVTPLTHLDGHAAALAVSERGDYVIAAGGNGALIVIDLDTKLITSYRGHNSQLTFTAPPTSVYPYFISADVRGAIRAWPLPSKTARVATDVHTRFVSAVFSKLENTTIATTFRPELTVLTPTSNVRAVSPHAGNATLLDSSENGRIFAAYGPIDTVEIWDSHSLSLEKLVSTGQGAISRVAFVSGTEDFVTGGRDGRLIYWTSTGKQKRSIQLNTSILNFSLTRDSTSAVINTSDGAIWRADQQGVVTRLNNNDNPAAKILNVPDSSSVAIGYENGDVVILDTYSWQQTLLLHVPQAIRDIAFTNDGRTIAVADNSDTIHVRRRIGNAWTNTNVIWTTFAARALRLAFASDGTLLIPCSDGTIWIYSLAQESWLCLRTGIADLTALVISTDGTTAAAFDTDGRALWVDLELARASLTTNSRHEHLKQDQK